ncbi:DMT family transporter [Sutterella sp.]|uniref:DMT family transporter n=1 Tax=Sutterella sp. TaxID=1981025 RepID=UPI0026DEE4B6|nr:DMT family transporter [Sutterella sp.]MDO5532277.1 DMT family transporter [Sutterella sp.]
MLIGVLLGIAAGALWGLIYIAPLVVPEYSSVLVALSRFIAFGLISLPCLWIFRRELKAFSKPDVLEAFRLPLFGNVLFYALLTLCIRLAGAPLAGMFMAVIPVLVAISSNMRNAGSDAAVPWSKILPPLAIILLGLVMANLTEFEHAAAQSAEGGEQFWMGVGFGVAAVIAWTWFSIKNAEWLLAHPHHSTGAWTTLQGVTVLPVALGLFIALGYGFGFMDTTVTALGPEPLTFLAVALSIGLLCSWVAMICWNRMSQILPAALGGQLIVFESVFAVIYALIWRGELPTLSMTLGFIVLMGGVLGSLRVFESHTHRTPAEAPLPAAKGRGASPANVEALESDGTSGT